MRGGEARVRGGGEGRARGRGVARALRLRVLGKTGGNQEQGVAVAVCQVFYKALFAFIPSVPT